MARSAKSQSDSHESVPARRSGESTRLDTAVASHPTVMRVLLVEDDEAIAAGLCFFLEEAGYLVEWSQVGSGVISKVIAEPPNLLILDVQLGDADGRGIYRSLRNAGCSYRSCWSAAARSSPPESSTMLPWRNRSPSPSFSVRPRRSWRPCSPLVGHDDPSSPRVNARVIAFRP